jgi:hypothetical protein
MENLLGAVDSSLSILKTNEYLAGFITLFLVLYAGLAAPALPHNVASMFDYTAVKIVMLSLILIFLRGQKPGIALLLAVSFIISMHTLSTYKTFSHIHEMAAVHKSDVVRVKHAAGVPHDTHVKHSVAPEVDHTDVKWSSQDGTSMVKIHGEVYVHKDVPNCLPGGHGDKEIKGF